MTRKEKYSRLNGYREFNAHILALQDDRKRIETLATHITASYNLTPGGSGNHSKIEDCAIKLHEIDLRLEADISKMLNNRAEIEAAIDRLPKQKDRMLLRYRFIAGMRYEKIADLTCTSIRNIRYSIDRAIDKIEFWNL